MKTYCLFLTIKLKYTFITNIMSLLYIFSLLVINEGIPTSFDACKTRKPCEKITSEQVNVICKKWCRSAIMKDVACGIHY